MLHTEPIVKVIRDSIYNGSRLTTLELEFWRPILPELTRHRAFSFCFRSSRATNTDIYIDACQNDPWGPRHLTANQKGMVGREVQLRPHEQEVWEQTWITAPEAQGEMRDLAMAIKLAMNDSDPVELQRGMWHLPYINDEELANYDMQDLVKASAARCARVSIKRFDGTTSIKEDIDLCNRLIHNGHMSPLEMVAQATEGLPSNYNKNWLQYRKVIENGIPFGTLLSTN